MHPERAELRGEPGDEVIPLAAAAGGQTPVYCPSRSRHFCGSCELWKTE